MKQVNGLFEIMTHPDMLYLGYEQTQEGDRQYRPAAINFRLRRYHKLEELREALLAGTYRPGPYVEFKVYEPKERLISAPMLVDKIVQYVAHIILEAIYHDIFIPTSFACRGGYRKAEQERVFRAVGVHDLHHRPYGQYGQHVAGKKLQQFLKECPNGWVARLDNKKFFYTIDRDLLKAILRKRIADERFLGLLDVIIDSSPMGAKGLPLGNATSQNFANILMNELDQYSVRYLQSKRYMRYNDDVFNVWECREQARRYLALAKDFLVNRLCVTPNPTKTKISPVKNGVVALGFKIWPTHSLTKPQLIRRVKRKLRMMLRTLATLPMRDRADYRNKTIVPVAGSFNGMLRWCNGFGLAKKLFGHLRYIKLEHRKYYYGRKWRPPKGDQKWQKERFSSGTRLTRGTAGSTNSCLGRRITQFRTCR